LPVRDTTVALISEFSGTVLFLLFAYAGTQTAYYGSPPPPRNQVGFHTDPSALLYIALSFGMSLAVTAWVFFRISGGLFNPAVSLYRSIELQALVQAKITPGRGDF
jgi:aquaporin related protein